MPFKEKIVSYCEEVEQAVKYSGAANTILNINGQLKGYNTDGIAAIEAIKEKVNFLDKSILIIGAGGTARAITTALKNEKCKITITNRTIKTGENLAKQFGISFVSKPNLDIYDIIINATSIGMNPNTEEMPVEAKYLNGKLVFDVVYNPIMTKLLHIAEKQGCKTISGLKMFVNQAVIQFKLFTLSDIDKNFMEDKILEYVVS